MALLSLCEASKAFDLKIILSSVSFSIQEGERIAIVGKNGCGKSTLLKILLQECDLDEGERIIQNNLKLSYLPQIPEFDPALSVQEAIEASLVELKSTHKRLHEVNLALQNTPNDQNLLKEYEELTLVLDGLNAWDLDAKVEEVIDAFSLHEFKYRSIASLSGGEQKRVALSQILFQKCDILLLDEPTNHLDVEMVEFLEQKLLALKTTLVLISHDRYFIENLATRVVEVENGKLASFDGGYASYLAQKEELLRALSREHEVLLKLLKNEEEWLRRGVKARLKRNEGRKKRVLEMRQKAKSNPSIIHKMKLELQREQKAFNRTEGKNNKKMLFEAKEITQKMGDKILFEHLSFRILQRDKIAIVGKNGSGKSSLLKVLLGVDQPMRGKLERGEIRIGYFDQHRMMLDDEKNILETFCPFGGDRVDVRGKNMHVFGYLKNFLFPKEFLNQKIANLSGGEKNRLALALLFTKEYDCLILDEPTNDLDIATINILEENLALFDGCVLIVSHDRYFVDKVAERLFVFEGSGVVHEYYESYSQYLEDKKELAQYEKLEQEIALGETEKSERKEEKKKEVKLSYKDQRLLDLLPSELEEMESKIRELEYELSDPNLYQKKGISVIAGELEELRGIYEEKMMIYFELLEKSEALKSET
ncbi:ribosomal protection-like ABC-F family protein [Helicobacter pametensis]|uniref:ribosomal protection-like ABC-F family protein n=1 Tax=Helicobacter pametensis TaxID=95149 RepID=UPI0004836CBC|nr:ABC-F family ATP-binding cassette domain-containing protein [Helicobacter pametensis]